MEHVVYDEQSKRIEKTADGDKEVKIFFVVIP